MLKSFVKIAAAAAFAMAAPAMAQIQTVDPNQAYQDDVPPAPGSSAQSEADAWTAYPETPSTESEWTPVDPGAQNPAADPYAAPADPYAPPAAPGDTYRAPPAGTQTATVPRDDLISAAEGLFGRGARGLGEMLEGILREQGEPVAYIAGQEAGGAFVVGVRYGSGVMHHQVEGERAVYWTGPSIGFDAGADANKVFVLVYNLYDSQELFRRYPAAEGRAYFVGGFSAQYMRRGDVVLIPVRLGVGLRLGANAGYMRFSERNRWLPF